MVNFAIFILIFVSLNVALSFFRKKFTPGIYGADFLFFAPWLASQEYGLIEGLITAAAILTVHIATSIQIAHYILFATPAVLLAIYLGNTLQSAGFWQSIILYHLLSTIIIFISRGFGGKFLLFILFSFSFNVAVYYLYTVIA